MLIQNHDRGDEHAYRLGFMGLLGLLLCVLPGCKGLIKVLAKEEIEVAAKAAAKEALTASEAGAAKAVRSTARRSLARRVGDKMVDAALDEVEAKVAEAAVAEMGAMIMLDEWSGRTLFLTVQHASTETSTVINSRCEMTAIGAGAYMEECTDFHAWFKMSPSSGLSMLARLPPSVEDLVAFASRTVGISAFSRQGNGQLKYCYVALDQEFVALDPSSTFEANQVADSRFDSTPECELVQEVDGLYFRATRELLRVIAHVDADSESAIVNKIDALANKSNTEAPIVAQQPASSPPEPAPETLSAVDKVKVGDVVDAADLSQQDCDSLWMLRNWVYARHGYSFTTPRAKSYFNGRPDYHRNAAVTDKTVMQYLTPVDTSNRDLIRMTERQMDCK